ncbi:MAG: acetylxylan esterase [Planctomycetes bacterium]|nr:acetylxylan esterase [Planctomycetota bacterium]
MTRDRRCVALLGLWVVVIAVCSQAAVAAAPGAAKDGWEIVVTCDRGTGLYKADEPIVFTVRMTRDGKPVEEGRIDYVLELNGTQKVEEKSVALTSGVAPVRTQRSEPGCLMLQATCRLSEGATITAEAGAAVEYEKLAPSLPAPDDFDAFWAAQKKRLAETPMNARLTKVEVPNVPWAADVECYEVQLDVPGWVATCGYFSRPKNAKPKTCAAWITFHGAGAHSANLATVAGRAKHYGMLGMEINAHGLPNGKPAEFYKEQLVGDLKDYPFKGMDSRETCYFLGMYLRLARAVEFLCSQPEWDGKTVISAGSSQGGAQAILAAGLDSRVTVVSASLPALCDLAGPEAGRASGWPVGTRKLTQEQTQTMRYFDVCHFAARTKATAVIRAGLVDRTCWPSGVLSMVNQFKGEKHLFPSPLSGHRWSPPEAYAEASEKFKEIVAREARREPVTP